MTTRFAVSAITAAALALGSMSSFAAAGIPSTWQGVAPSEPQPGQTQINNPHPQYEGQQWQGQQWQRGQQVQRGQQWQRNQQWQRGQARHDHDRHEHHDRGSRDYGWQQPGYVYQEQPAYVYQQGYAYPQGYYQQPYYGYDNSDDGSNLVIGTILGGLIGGAIANSR